MSHKPSEAQIKAVTTALVDQGNIIEAGWIGFRAMVYPEGAPELQITETRSAFFAGAQHLFTSILHFLESDEEPTDADLDRMALVDRELREFIKDFEMRHVKTQGRA